MCKEHRLKKSEFHFMPPSLPFVTTITPFNENPPVYPIYLCLILPFIGSKCVLVAGDGAGMMLAVAITAASTCPRAASVASYGDMTT
jgi:hypothetical protein